MSRALVQALRARSVDVETAIEAGRMETPDLEHLRYAADAGRVLFSCNVGDFCQLHAEFLDQGSTHSGIVVDHQMRHPIGRQLKGLLRLMDQLQAQDMVDRLEFLGSWV